MLSSDKIIAFVPTRDPEKARAFYVDVLGLSFVKDDGFATVLTANGNMVRVVRTGAEFKPAQFTLLGWEVQGIAEKVKDLQGRGVTFERFGFFEQDALGIWTAPNGDKIAWFKDPDGNTLSISEHV
jgi:catechol 2,3-dioxygenase-like lactoylglutathione lyase family enzyme